MPKGVQPRPPSRLAWTPSAAADRQADTATPAQQGIQGGAYATVSSACWDQAVPERVNAYAAPVCV
jgi:hypothetical protein